MVHDVVVIPAKGLRTGKSRLMDCLLPSSREALNLSQLTQTVRAACELFGPDHTYVVSPCGRVEDVVRREGVRFIRESAPPGLNEALEQARSALLPLSVRSISVLPVDLPCVSAEILRQLFAHYSQGALVVPDRAGDGTNFLRLPAGCDIPFSYGPGSFGEHVRLLAQAGFPPGIIGDTCLRDDLDDIRHLRMHDRYRELLTD